MDSSHISLTRVTFQYEGSHSPVFESITVRFARGWTGLVGANGAGKSTLLMLAAGMMAPTGGLAQTVKNTYYLEQRTDTEPGGLVELLFDYQSSAVEIKADLGIAESWHGRWDTLSHGERKRAQIGCALYADPAVLLVDEPGNHLDADSRERLITALRRFDGIGLIVSHDRDMLDALCDSIVFIEPPSVVKRSGTYTSASMERAREMEHARREYAQAKREERRLKKEAVRRREEALRADSLRSKKGLPPRDRDARGKKNLAILTGRDGVAGKLARIMDARLERVSELAASLTPAKSHRLGIWFDVERSGRSFVISLPESTIPLGDGRVLRTPALAVGRSDHIGLTGRNGTGKTTLVRRIMDTHDLSPDRVVYIPQEIDASSSRECLEDVLRLDNRELGMLMTIIRRLNSDPARLFETALPSPGEIRKLLLARGILHRPHLIVMDEPTNHLDLPSIECLEAALADCPIALLLVSHDMRFLSRCVGSRWIFEDEDDGSISVRIGDVRGPV